MAESTAQSDQINAEMEKKATKEMKLMYLGFIHVAAIQTVLCLSRLYDLAKENSGPLKPGVESVEGTVKAVVGPVYDKFHGVPFDILKFVDHKVGDAAVEVERHVPSLVKEASNQVRFVTQKAPKIARSISAEFQRAGVMGTAAELAKVAYTKAQPVAKQYAVSAWRSLNKLPVFPNVAQVVVPTAARWTNKYNKAVRYSAAKGYALAMYLPVVSTERIASVFGEDTQANAAAAQ